MKKWKKWHKNWIKFELYCYLNYLKIRKNETWNIKEKRYLLKNIIDNIYSFCNLFNIFKAF